MTGRLRATRCSIVASIMLATPMAAAQEAGQPAKDHDDTQGLAKQAQDPIAHLINVPFQNNSKLPINASVQAFDNVEKPEFGADWTLRLQVQVLFQNRSGVIAWRKSS